VRLKGEYVSVEQLALALIEEGDKSDAGRLLAELGSPATASSRLSPRCAAASA
jgi:hypothetical protein